MEPLLTANSCSYPFQINGIRVPAEAFLQNKAQHRYVVKIYEVLTTEEHYVYVMERPEMCKDLFDILQLKVTLAEKEARRYFSQIIEANISCEENGVIHRDLKPENILVDLHNDEAKLIDFGLASEVQEKPFVKFRGENENEVQWLLKHLKQVGYSMVYHEKALHNYFIPCHRKHVALHNRCGARWEGSVEYRRIYNRFLAFWPQLFKERITLSKRITRYPVDKMYQFRYILSVG